MALTGYLAAAIGFPMPVQSSAAPDATGCASHLCGCPADARERKQCCCSTPAQQATAVKACCSKPAEPVAPACPNCATKSDAPSCTDACCASDEPEAPPQYQIRFVLGEPFQKCRGLSTLWVQAGAALPPPASIALPAQREPSGYVVVRYQPLAIVTFSPATPPPRLPVC